jgi:hypothetical protein
MTLIPFLFICIAVILVGALEPKPGGYVVLLFAVLALLIALGQKFPFS